MQIRCRVFDNGKIVNDTGLRKAHSWVLNHYRYVFVQASGMTSIANFPLYDTFGNEFNSGWYDLAFSYEIYSIQSAYGNTGYGVVIGTSTSPVVSTDSALAAILPHGSSSNEILYNQEAYAAWDSANKLVNISRTFTNESGDPIVVTEVGKVIALFQYPDEAYGPDNKGNFLMCRDVLDSSITVGNLQTLQVDYVITFANP